MAAAQGLLLQQGTICRVENHLYHHQPSLQFPCSSVSFKFRTKSFKHLTVKSFSLTNNSSVNVNRRSINGDYNQDFNKSGFPKFEIKRNPVETAAETLMNALKALQKPAAKAVVILLGLLLLTTCAPNKSALAASGGRISRSSSSYSSRRRSSSRKSRRRYSSTYRSRSSYSCYYSSSSSSSSPTTMIENSAVSDDGGELSSMRRRGRCVRRLQKSPFGWYHFAPAVAPTVPSSSSSSALPSSSSRVAPEKYYYDDRRVYILGILVLLAFGSACEIWYNISKGRMSVLKLQVGLLGLESLQKDLNRIAETANTSTDRGLHYLLTDTVLTLLRYPDYCISAYSSIDMNWTMEGAEERFYQLSLEERGKFDDETLVNVSNIRKRSSTTMQSSRVSNEYMVVTILVTARRKLELPSINNSRDLKEMLEKLGSLPLSRTVAVEVLWTPPKEDATVSQHKLLENYPLLRPI